MELINSLPCGAPQVARIAPGELVELMRHPDESLIKYRVASDALYNENLPVKIREGAVLLCRTNFHEHEINCRTICVVYLTERGETLARTICRHPANGTDSYMLRPLNPAFNSIFVAADCVKILAVAEKVLN